MSTRNCTYQLSNSDFSNISSTGSFKKSFTDFLYKFLQKYMQKFTPGVLTMILPRFFSTSSRDSTKNASKVSIKKRSGIPREILLTIIKTSYTRFHQEFLYSRTARRMARGPHPCLILCGPRPHFVRPAEGSKILLIFGPLAILQTQTYNIPGLFSFQLNFNLIF